MERFQRTDAGSPSGTKTDEEYGAVLDENVTLDLARGFSGAQLTGDVDAQGNAEDWPVVMEQAYAQYLGRYSTLENGVDPASISSVCQLLTGMAETTVNLSGMTDQEISDLMNAHRTDGMVLATKSTVANSQLVPNHAYAVVGFDPGADGNATGWKVYNPWGNVNRYYPANLDLPINGLSANFSTLTYFSTY